MNDGSIRVQSYLVVNKNFHFVCDVNKMLRGVREDILLSKYPGIVAHAGNRVVRADGSDIPRVSIIQLVDEGGMKRFLIDDTEFRPMRGGSSRGQAPKAKVGGMWYKLTQGTFNAQAEVVASRLAAYTNLGESVMYDICIVNGEYATMSKDFLGGMDSETVTSLHAKVTGNPIELILENLSGHGLFKYVRSVVKKGIGVDLEEADTFRKLSLLLQFDALILNDDRHFNNIAFVQRGDTWGFSAAFDFDCALFSCLEDLDDISTYAQPSQPFYSPHNRQLEWLYSLSDDRLVVRAFNVDDLIRGVWDDTHQIGKCEIVKYLGSVRGNAGGA